MTTIKFQTGQDPDDEKSQEWHGEDWISFHWATHLIQTRRGLSTGKAQRTLRELCATGDIRSILYEIDEYLHETEGQLIATSEPYKVKPSEWAEEALDFRDGCWVDVSEDDVTHWLDRQKPTEAKAERRTSKKRELASQAIKALWPIGIPEIPNAEIEKQVGNWITSYCKRNNLSKLDISSDTILRAAGRK
jgi:hypothetical protein